MNKKYLNILTMLIVIAVLALRLIFGETIPAYFGAMSILVITVYIALLIFSTGVFIIAYFIFKAFMRNESELGDALKSFIDTIRDLIKNKNTNMRIATIALSVLLITLAIKNGFYFLAALEIITEIFNIWVSSIDPETLNTEK